MGVLRHCCGLGDKGRRGGGMTLEGSFSAVIHSGNDWLGAWGSKSNAL